MWKLSDKEIKLTHIWIYTSPLSKCDSIVLFSDVWYKCFHFCFFFFFFEIFIEPLLCVREINSEYSLEGLMLKLKLQYFGHPTGTHNSLENPWCWERLTAEGEEGTRGWDGWKALLMQCTWTWANFKRWRGTGSPGMLYSMGSQKVGHDWATEQQ